MQNASVAARTNSISASVSVIAIVAVLYALSKGVTAFVLTPFGVGQLLIFIFIPAFFAVVSPTLPVAIGAGLGTFIGDTLFLTPNGSTNPALSLIAGVPANFLAFLLYGWFVKQYRSWPAFVAATVSFVTLGNLIAASSIVLFGAAVFTPINGLITRFDLAGLILGFTVFWTSTMIPAILLVVPILTRSVKPLVGHSPILVDYPNWSGSAIRNQLAISLALAVLLLAMGAIFFLAAPSTLGLFPGVTTYFVITVASVLILGPLAGTIAGSKLMGK
jgi:hypothetical protein